MHAKISILSLSLSLSLENDDWWPSRGKKTLIWKQWSSPHSKSLKKLRVHVVCWCVFQRLAFKKEGGLPLSPRWEAPVTPGSIAYTHITLIPNPHHHPQQQHHHQHHQRNPIELVLSTSKLKRQERKKIGLKKEGKEPIIPPLVWFIPNSKVVASGSSWETNDER